MSDLINAFSCVGIIVVVYASIYLLCWAFWNIGGAVRQKETMSFHDDLCALLDIDPYKARLVKIETDARRGFKPSVTVERYLDQHEQEGIIDLLKRQDNLPEPLILNVGRPS